MGVCHMLPNLQCPFFQQHHLGIRGGGGRATICVETYGWVGGWMGGWVGGRSAGRPVGRSVGRNILGIQVT